MSTAATTISATFAAGNAFSATIRAYERVVVVLIRLVPLAAARSSASTDESPGNRVASDSAVRDVIACGCRDGGVETLRGTEAARGTRTDAW